GLNRHDHQLSVSDLVTDYRSAFVGLLETRVTAPNSTCIQMQLLPCWKWFINYTGPDTRIWIALDDDFGLIDLGRLAQGIDESPWLVGGDFNTVLDISEVCGNLGDIGLAMADFLECLHDKGLLNLPMQGETFTWHNCSIDSRGL
ncbi:UNVERIFIED_CONTAM: hypothetical protein Sindi_1991800, partial [Sesamum indicum]